MFEPEKMDMLIDVLLAASASTRPARLDKIYLQITILLQFSKTKATFKKFRQLENIY